MPHMPLLLPWILIAPQHAHGASLFKQDLTRRSHRPRLSRSTRSAFLRSSSHRSTHTAPLSYCRISHAAPTARGDLAASAASFPCSGFIPSFWPAVLLRHASARTHARTRMHGRQPTNERCDVRSAGVADWITARQGNTERTLTAAAGPSPRDPYRHALTMQPPPKVRHLVS